MKTFLKYFAFIFLLGGLTPVAQAKQAKTEEQAKKVELALNKAREKAIDIAREHIKSANEDIRDEAIQLFKSLINQDVAVDIALEVALECIASEGYRWVGLVLLNHLINQRRYELKKVSGTIW